jgi:hypothetical protein
VVGARSSNTVLISADGQYQKNILTKADGLNQPSAVCFDEPKKQLLVANVEDGMVGILDSTGIAYFPCKCHNVRISKCISVWNCRYSEILRAG